VVGGVVVRTSNYGGTLSEPLIVTHTYAASPADLYQAIGAGSLFVGGGARPTRHMIDFREGGEINLDFGADGTASGVVTELVPDRRIAFRWTADTHVTLDIEATGDGSRLTVTHDGIPSDEWRAAFAAGWRDGVHGLVVPALAPSEMEGTADERGVLRQFLEFHRAVLVSKLRGVSEADARRRLVPSLTTLIGLVQHMTGVERNWFQHFLARRSRAEIGWNNRGSDESWDVAPEKTISDVISEYEEACAESRRIMAGLDMESEVPHPQLGRMTLRWVLVHMVEETARHAGHADILRELTDGATGVLPD
jgi:uncharacterized protein YndB with AHSA1/START domain/uncharacterized damage-inducible protein DinB